MIDWRGFLEPATAITVNSRVVPVMFNSDSRTASEAEWLPVDLRQSSQ